MSNTFRFWLLLLGGALLLGVIGWSWQLGTTDLPPLRIAVAGPMSGSFKDVGSSMRRGAEMAVMEINRQGGIQGRPLLLTVGDDQSELNQTTQATKVAHQLTALPDLVGVVGHYFSVPTMEAGRLYAQNEIPVISPSITHPDATATNDWIFSLMANDFHQAIFLANYVVHGLQRQKIGVIHSNSAYGKSLREYFVNELRIKGLTPTVDLEVDSAASHGGPLDAHLQALRGSDILLLAMNYQTAAGVIKHLREQNVTTDLIGGESLGGPHFIRAAGSYADGVYAVAPFLPNLHGEESRRFQENFLKEFQLKPDWIAAYVNESVKLLALAANRVGTDKRAIRDFLRKINNEPEAVESLAGPIHFDDFGSSRRPLAIGQVTDGYLVPARFQLTPVTHPELAKARGQRDDTFLMNGRFMKRTTVVFTGLYVSEIKAFDPIGAHFTADFILWFRWDPAQNPKLDFEMTYGKVVSAKIREKYSDPQTNNNFISYEVSAILDGEFPLHHYPLDTQILKIRIKPKIKPQEDLILVTDIPDDSFLRRRLDFGSWLDLGHIQFTGRKPFIWSYRNPKYDQKLFELDHSQFDYHVQVKRKVSEYVIKLIPLLVVVATAYLVFFIGFDFVASRFSIGVTTMLSAMAFHGVNKLEVGYLVKIDLFFMMTYFLIFLSLVETAMASFAYGRGHPRVASRLDLAAMVVYPLLLLGGVQWIFH